jgi:hypothetical protein
LEVEIKTYYTRVTGYTTIFFTTSLVAGDDAWPYSDAVGEPAIWQYTGTIA